MFTVWLQSREPTVFHLPITSNRLLMVKDAPVSFAGRGFLLVESAGFVGVSV